MVSYALLIVIAVGISVVAYNYLKLYLPSQREECPGDISIFVESAICSRSENTLSITLSNRGLFNASAFFLRFGEAGRQIRGQINPEDESLPFSIPPGSESSYSFTYDIETQIRPGSTSYILEIQPAVFIDGKTVVCEDSATTFNIECPLPVGG